MTGASPTRDMTVVMTGNRITGLGKSGRVRLPKRAQIIDGTDKFLLPGLWDMHAHIRETERSFPLFIANGVLGIRDMGGKPEDLFRWRDEVARGALLGPRIVACGPIIDGPEPAAHGPTVSVRTADEGRKAVADLKRRGADFVKVYDRLPRDAYFAIVEEARKQGLPVAGHVPQSVTTMEASDAGQRSIEHLGTILEGSSSVEAELRQAAAAPLPADVSEFPRRIAARGERMLATYDEQKAKELFTHLVRNRTWQVPTLVVKRALTFIDDIVRDGDARLKYIPRSEQEWWSPQKNFLLRYRTPEYIAYSRKLFQASLELVGAMHRAGVPILAGTDVISAYVFPGFSLHDELSLLVQAGLPPMAALQAATRNPAMFLKETGSMGTIEHGKLADLVLLDANPLEDIENIRRIHAVIVNGRYLSRESLQQLLASAEASAGK
ncbi:MAG: amidohydrolase family protein [Acidobacteriota bacterium]|nr:amidohydrolase family protein [Acidobacteriota bacterium]